MEVWESLRQASEEKSNGCGKTESPNRTEVFVSMVMLVVSDTEVY